MVSKVQLVKQKTNFGFELLLSEKCSQVICKMFECVLGLKTISGIVIR